MEYLPLIGTVALINVLGAISPGPDFVMVVRTSLNYSRKAGIFTAIGIGLGLGFHLIYCSVGFAYLIAKSPIIFNIIKYLGVAYLAYMGFQCIRATQSKIEIYQENISTELVPISAIKIGFFTNILNPKATLFFLGLFSFFIKPQTPAWVLIVISVIIILTAIIWFSIVSTFFTQKRIQTAFFKYEKFINSLFGILLILLALKVAFS